MKLLKKLYKMEDIIAQTSASKRTIYNNKDIMTNKKLVQKIKNKNYFTEEAMQILKDRYPKAPEDIKKEIPLEEPEEEIERMSEPEIFTPDAEDIKSNLSLEVIQREYNEELKKIIYLVNANKENYEARIKDLKEENQKKEELMEKHIATLENTIKEQSELLKQITEKRSIWSRLFKR